MNTSKRIEINNDLLTEILARLPPKSIFRFISVSKRWSNIINGPLFLRSYSKLRRSSAGEGRLLALFQTKPTVSRFQEKPIQMNIFPIRGIRQPNITIRDKHVPKRGLGFFMNSSNGLILCAAHHIRRKMDVTTYNVLNPVTRNFVTLPPPPALRPYQRDFSSNDGLMCEENTAALAPSYIVVRVSGVKGKTMQIDTYSSTTEEWASSTLVPTGDVVGPLRIPPVVVNGVFHWIMMHKNVAVYNPNKNKNHLQLIEAPCVTSGDYSSIIVTRSQNDILWYGSSTITGLKFWKLEKKGEGGSYKRHTTIGHDEWILMHDISLKSLYKGDLWENDCRFRFRYEVVFGGVVSRDPPVVLLKKMDEWFLHNFKTKTSKLVEYHGHLLSNGYYISPLRPFLESSFLSSCALLLVFSEWRRLL